MPTVTFIDSKFKASFIEGHIIYIELNDFEIFEPEDILKLRHWISNDIKGKKLYNIFQFGNGSSISREARELAAKKEDGQVTLGTAIIVRNMAQQLIVDYYLKINKPERPTKAFFKYEKATAWVLNKINSD